MSCQTTPKRILMHSFLPTQNLGVLFAIMWGFIILAYVALWNAVRNINK